MVPVGGDCHVAHPVGVWGPDAGGEPGLLEEVGEVDIGGGVEVPAYHVAGLGHVEFLEQL